MVRVPKLFIDAALRRLARLGIRRRVAGAGDCNAVVPARITVGVGHSGHYRPSHVQWINIAGRIGASALITRHHSGVLVGNGTLGCHHLLVLQELLLPLVAVIAVATVHVLRVVLLVRVRANEKLLKLERVQGHRVQSVKQLVLLAQGLPLEGSNRIF